MEVICAREYARPSPTDMPYSQRDILNKKQNMKNYIKALKSFKVAPRLAGNEADGIGHLMVEGEKIRIPSSANGLSEVSKIYLDQNKLRRYLGILNMELEATPATIELDSSKIIDYVKRLNKPEGKTADLLSRSRIKLMRGGRTDNNMYNRGYEEAGLYDEDYLEGKDNGLAYSTMDKNQLPDSYIKGKNPEECLSPQNSDYADLDYSKPGRDVAENQYLQGDTYNLDSELGDRLLESNVKQVDIEKKNIPEYFVANKFNGEENYNDVQPLDLEYIDNLHNSQIQTGVAPEKKVDTQDPNGSKEGLDSLNNTVVGNVNEKSELNGIRKSEYEKNKDQSLFDSPFDIPVHFDHVISKDPGDLEEKQDEVNVEKGVESQDTKLKQQIEQEEVHYENAKILEPSVGVGGSGGVGRTVKDTNPQLFGSVLDNLLNKLTNTKKPVNKLTDQVANVSASISNLNNPIIHQQNTLNDLDNRKAIEIQTATFIQNHSSTESPLIWKSASNSSSDHMIFPLKPEDEIINVPKMKYFEQCFDPRTNGQVMPTKPPKMFSQYYLSKLKKFDSYNDDSGIRNFLEEPRLPLFGTKESEISKILNVNLDHLHLDRGALYKIVGKALKIDEENPRVDSPPKWLEAKYDELLHASHRGQNFNDYDYIEKSRNMFMNDRFNIRNRKKSVLEKNSKC